MNENNSFDSVIPHFDSSKPRLPYGNPASCSNLMFSDVCPLKKYWKLVAASRASGHRFPPNVALKGFVFSKQSHGCQTHLWNYDWFLVVCSRRWMKNNKNRHRSQEQQQQCRWGLEQHPPTTCCYLFEFYSFPHIAWFSTRAHKFRAWNSKMATQVCRRSDHLRQPLTYLPGKSRDGQIFGGPGCREVYMTPVVPRPTSQKLFSGDALFFVFKHLFEPFLPSQLPLHATHCSHALGSIASAAARLKVPPHVPWREIGQLDHTPTVAGHHTSIGTHQLLLLL